MAGENDLFNIEAGKKRPQEEILSRVVSSTFEKMGFMEARLTEEEPAAADRICARIEILAPFHAQLFFSAPRQLGWTIAENLYGLQELTLEAVADMMTELLNTITGSLLSEVLPDQQFNLAIPRLCTEMPDNQAQSYVYHFNIDNNGIITITLAADTPDR